MKHGNFHSFFKVAALAVFALMTVVSCGPMKGGFAPADFHISGDNGTLSTPLPQTSYQVEAAPLWESVNAGSRDWTLYSFGIVDTLGPALVNGSSDMGSFCPNYSNMTRNQKLNFWVYLVSAVAKYESSEDPTNRYQESTLGTDSVTHQPVWSEGLLQLSYQDQKSYSFCSFNWAADSKLSPTDPNKTILQPKPNLLCGIQILNHQLAAQNKIAVSSSAYWSTLEPQNAHTAVPSIEKLTKALPFCQL